MGQVPLRIVLTVLAERILIQDHPQRPAIVVVCMILRLKNAQLVRRQVQIAQHILVATIATCLTYSGDMMDVLIVRSQQIMVVKQVAVIVLLVIHSVGIQAGVSVKVDGVLIARESVQVVEVIQIAQENGKHTSMITMKSNTILLFQTMTLTQVLPEDVVLVSLIRKIWSPIKSLDVHAQRQLFTT